MTKIIASLKKILTLLVFFHLYNCSNETTEKIILKDAIINSFLADKQNIIIGDSVKLSWNVSNATDIKLNNSSFNLTLVDDTIIKPNKSFTYQLVAKNNFSTDTAVLNITLTPKNSLPVITNFDAKPSNLILGETCHFSWIAVNATYFQFDTNGKLMFKNDTSLIPNSSKKYSIMAFNNFGSDTAFIDIIVSPKTPIPMISLFTANPAEIIKGQSSTLMWSVSNASTFQLDQGIGIIAESSIIVSPTISIKYTLIASNNFGKDTATVSLIVNQPTSLAEIYPNDLGIEKDSNVVFTEMAEEKDLTELFSNWTLNSSSNSIALDNSTIPSKSKGSKSIRLFTTAGKLGDPGVILDARLWKSFTPGFTDSIYARWYVKYNSNRTFHHTGGRVGGTNPIVIKTIPQLAGIRPVGNDFFYVGAETSQGKLSPVSNSTFDYYIYWLNQRGSSFFPGQYFGNSFINNPNVNIDMNSWNCIEIRVKLNNPITQSNGGITMWINGIKVSEIKQNTTGNWNEDDFTPGNGSPFEGFQFRNDNALNINFFWLEHFVDKDKDGEINSVNYDHIVLAKKYIGPIK